ncbi:helix-turn-helix domain-containing protein [Streptomyces sp. V2I9]|uniref:helix-turn-helix domain-containing protein n=1 Tax=Streptomyces sp. V2I9 TaxID=3042304 RepID=UPI00277FF358|nr:helix-turn-helix domain-containing protein [Streptomyces sp. V2I9]MDQ0987566.1 transcriptional regulator with XRE-family HTH domain [Streptomyces sp. V2I9]
MTTELADNVRKYRRRAGLSQEELAHTAGVSPGTVRKVEQGGTVRMETLHTLARALGVTTATLLAPDAPQPVGRGEDPNRVNLIQLRAALTPPVGLAEPDGERAEEEPNLRRFRRTVHDGAVLYHSDSYKSVASQLPALLRDADTAVAHFDHGEEHQQALLARAEAMQLAGRYLTQVRQYDLAYTALSHAITDARHTGDTLTAASGVIGMCWLLLRQGRLDEAEQLAAQTADVIEPRLSRATPDECAAWGWLALRAAAAAGRNNRPQEARHYHRVATTAAAAVGREHTGSFFRHWTTFGPLTVGMKGVEDAMIVGDARTVVRKSSEDAMSPKAWKHTGRPSDDNWNRHRLDVARAHARTGDLTGAMDELAGVRHASPEWLRHQRMAAETMQEILKKRKRTLTADMREMADHLGVVG